MIMINMIMVILIILTSSSLKAHKQKVAVATLKEATKLYT